MPHHLMSEADFNRMVEVNVVNYPSEAKQREIERLKLINRTGMYHVTEPARVKMLQNPALADRIKLFGFGGRPTATDSLPVQFSAYKDAVTAAINNNASAANANVWIIVNMTSNIMTIRDMNSLNEKDYTSDIIAKMMQATVISDRFIVGFVSPDLNQRIATDTMRAYYNTHLVKKTTPANDPITMAFYNSLSAKPEMSLEIPPPKRVDE